MVPIKEPMMPENI
jgi:hypothetical protein